MKHVSLMLIKQMEGSFNRISGDLKLTTLSSSGRKRDFILDVTLAVFIPHYVSKLLYFVLCVPANHVDIGERSSSLIRALDSPT